MPADALGRTVVVLAMASGEGTMRRQGSKSVMRSAGILAISALAVAALSACSSAPAEMTVHGTVEIAVQTFDEFSQYSQVTDDDAQVTVTDPSGKVIGVTTANNGDVNQGPSVAGDLTETVGFTVKVPEGESFYGVSVSGIPGTIHFTQQQMQAGPAVCAGDACSSG
jgi:hypothetical protein